MIITYTCPSILNDSYILFLDRLTLLNQHLLLISGEAANIVVDEDA